MSDKKTAVEAVINLIAMACGKNIYETEISAKVSKLVINVWQSSSKM